MNTIDSYATHQYPLIRSALSILQSEDDPTIIELGIGHYSTPILLALCEQLTGKLISITSSAGWASKFRHLERPDLFEIRLINETAWPLFEPPPASMYFVDNEELTKDRLKHLTALSKQSKLVVMHDACTFEREGHDWQETMNTIPNFKYLKIYRGLKPATAILATEYYPALFES